jgi:hypothetical protein
MLAHLAVQNLRRSPNSSCRFRRAQSAPGNVAALSIPSLVGSLTIVLNGGASKAPAERLMNALTFVLTIIIIITMKLYYG